jgi:fructose-1,6-bisphosphatase/inositol monophosphatase family enzyme
MLFENEGCKRDISVKKDRSLVTDLDSKAEKIITSMIRNTFPAHGVLGEEGGESQTGSDYLWIIDPIDGTHNYIRGIPLYGVSIGVVYKEEFIAGVIYLPHDDLLYASEKGSGTFKNGRRVYVSKINDINACTLSYDSCLRDDREGIRSKGLGHFGLTVFNVRMFGSSVIALTCLAEGKLDIVVEFDDKAWDFAAGASLVMEAGGAFTDFHGNTATYKTSGYTGTNGLVHERVLKELREVLG